MFAAEHVTGSVPGRGRFEFTFIFLVVFGHILFFSSLTMADDVAARKVKFPIDFLPG